MSDPFLGNAIEISTVYFRGFDTRNRKSEILRFAQDDGPFLLRMSLGRIIVAGWGSNDGGGPTPLFMNAYRRAFPDAPLPPLSAGMSHLKNPANLLDDQRPGASVLVVSVLHRARRHRTGALAHRRG